jgi:hypothetical protein
LELSLAADRSFMLAEGPRIALSGLNFAGLEMVNGRARLVTRFNDEPAAAALERVVAEPLGAKAALEHGIPPLTKLTILQFGSNDRNLLLASAGDIAQSLEEIIRRVRAKGSAVILVRQWPPSDAAAFAAVEQSADSFVTWYTDVYYEGKLRPEYDSGDHAHLNAAGTDVIVARAVPDVERLLMRLGSRPTR